MRTIRIGSGAGYSGDRIEPAVELAENGNIDYLVFECLGERTVALAQQARMKNPESGYDPLLEERMRAVLPLCASKGIRPVCVFANTLMRPQSLPWPASWNWRWPDQAY